MPKVRRSILARPHLAKALTIGPSGDGATGARSSIPDLEKKLLDQNRELLALLEISQTATKTLETEEILNATLDKSMELLGFDVGYIRTLDKSNKNLIVRVARGLSSPEFLTTAFPLDSSDAVVGTTVFKSQRPHVSVDVRKDPEFKSRTMEREGLVSLAMIPIVSKEDVHGFIALGSKRFHDFSEIELRLISDASSRLGTALTNARLFHAAQARTADLEQRLYEQLVQLERLSRLKRFLSSHLAEMILAGGPNDPLKAHRREITVVYLGLTGFAAFAAYSEYEEVMKVLRQYHREMGRLILECDGTLERFAGDRMMVVFNDPVEIANPAKRAVRMALAMRERVKELSQEWCRFNYDLGFHAGIAHGFATLGVIGYEGRIDYGAIGRVTNIASGLCDEAKHDQILVSQRVAGLVEDIVQSEVAGNLTLRDFPVPVMAHALVRLKD